MYLFYQFVHYREKNLEITLSWKWQLVESAFPFLQNAKGNDYLALSKQHLAT